MLKNDLDVQQAIDNALQKFCTKLEEIKQLNKPSEGTGCKTVMKRITESIKPALMLYLKEDSLGEDCKELLRDTRNKRKINAVFTTVNEILHRWDDELREATKTQIEAKSYTLEVTEEERVCQIH